MNKATEELKKVLKRFQTMTTEEYDALYQEAESKLNQSAIECSYQKILELEKIDEVDAISYVFDELEDRMLVGEYTFTDEFMKNMDIEKYCVSVLIGVIVITKPFQEKLNNRVEFKKNVKEFVYKTYDKDEADAIWNGLDDESDRFMFIFGD